MLNIFNMVDSYKISFIVFLTFPYKNNSAKLPIVLEPSLQKAYGGKWLLWKMSVTMRAVLHEGTHIEVRKSTNSLLTLRKRKYLFVSGLRVS